MDQVNLATQALTTRIVASTVRPLSAKEFWPLARAADVASLVGRAASELAAELALPVDHADRIARLLDRSSAIALAAEELEHRGIWVLGCLDDGYPARLAERLGDGAPPLLHGVGDRGLLSIDGIGVVGSRDADPEAIDVANSVARLAAAHNRPVVSGGARGVDQHAMNAAFETGGSVVGVLADSLERTVSRASIRRGISGGQICLVTPYAPTAGFSAGNAMGRNKIVYALSKAVVVVRSEEGSGGTWAGATEALSKRYSTVLTWTGPGSGPGNAALIRRGAIEVRAHDQLEPALGAARPVAQSVKPPPADQLALPLT